MAYQRREGGAGGRSGGRSFGNKGGFNKGGGFGGSRFAKGEMHSATCDSCNKRCEVPFKPNGKKPVFCSNCFVKDSGDGESRFSESRPERPRFGDKPAFDATCDKCSKQCTVPFRPTGSKPIFCRDCFGSADQGGMSNMAPRGSSTETYAEQFKALNKKLDLILEILEDLDEEGEE